MIPDLMPEYIHTGITPSSEFCDPVALPLLVYMSGTALKRDGCAEQYDVGDGRNLSDQMGSKFFFYMLGNLKAYCQIIFFRCGQFKFTVQIRNSELSFIYNQFLLRDPCPV